ncbi:14262_t:CDS:2 [Cetraspora pellucida]|uniref:14262_t:CDS:1 n=1 Tax=Cetraspora pellucida TaxID=1433469 RepID=A0A9N9C8M3_9GLOM|nr:14262_t:CDS:2 [Cetraspora pellucida]
MTPITWNVNDKSALLDVDSNGLRVNYTAELNKLPGNCGI